jgi:dehydrogenase/reductase SDR family member 7B
MNFFSGKIAWITGASSGIGEALVYALNERGANVIISARRQVELERVKAFCKHPSTVTILPFDLSDSSAIYKAVESVKKQFSGVDYLFNNGGISQRSEVINTPLEIDRRVMEVNFFSYVTLTKALLPLMIQNGGGQIIVTSSVNGKCALPLRSAYAASKHALHGFFEALREENYRNNIRVLMVLPGFIKTDLTLNAITESGEAFNKMGEGQEKGLTASLLASKILKAIESKKEEVYIGGKDVFIIYIKRYLPRLYYKIIRKVKTV